MLNDEIDRLREERDDERAKRYVLEKSNAWFLVAEQQKQEIERLRAALKGAEIALARDGNIEGAMTCILSIDEHKQDI